jgi:hypothetical protein
LRTAVLMILRAMPHNQDRNFAGSRNCRSCFQSVTKVSWARSSLWVKLPVALNAIEQISAW